MSQYKVRNWSQYNESLKNRGSIFLWVSDDALKKWQVLKDPHFIGAPPKFSNDAILCMMVLKSLYHLPYRQLIGFLLSLFSIMKVVLPVPHFTTVGKRARKLGCALKKLSKRRPTDLVFDSSGFKVYGEGEWKVRQHGKQKRRRWKKFHIGICPASHEIVVAEATELETADCEVGPRLIRKAPGSVKRVIGDGAYDTNDCYQSAYERDAKLLVPPRQGAVMRETEGAPWITDRNESLAQIIGFKSHRRSDGIMEKAYRISSEVSCRNCFF